MVQSVNDRAVTLVDQTGVPYSSGNPLPTSGGGGGGGGAVTIADGADVTQGAKADAAYSDGTGAASGSAIAILKALFVRNFGATVAQLGARTTAQSPAVNLASDDAQVGVKVTAQTIGAGGSGIIGWLSEVAARISAPTPSGTNTIGQTNGNGASVEYVATVTASSYTAGYVIGGILPFANILPASFNGILESLTLKFKGSVQTTEFDVAIFSASPTGTFTDHAAPAIATTDSALLLGIFPLTANQSQLGTHTVYTLDGIAKQIVGSSTSLYAVVITRSAPANAPASTSDMSLRVGVAW